MGLVQSCSSLFSTPTFLRRAMNASAVSPASPSGPYHEIHEKQHTGSSKALLVGISYARMELKPSPTSTKMGKENVAPNTMLGKVKECLTKKKKRKELVPALDVLTAAHSDVSETRKMLIEIYNYKPEEIVTLADEDGAPPHTLPTRANIIQEIKNLVNGAKPGDRLYFHYSGHCVQVESSEDTSEADGLDECLVPCNGDVDDERSLIKDDLLNKLLVAPLLPGVSLTAVFDTCHSETLLDLEHGECNRVYVPWISKGRRDSTSIRAGVVRKLALEPTDKSPLIRSQPSVPLRGDPTSKLRLDTNNLPQMPLQYLKISPIPQCESPISNLPCEGFCKPAHGKSSFDAKLKGKANVISLSSCTDNQNTLESDNGGSTTMTLIGILRQTPHPTYRNLLLSLSYKCYENVFAIHTESQTQRRMYNNYRRAKGKRLKKTGLDLSNFQDPQLSSHVPLNLDNVWSP